VYTFGGNKNSQNKDIKKAKEYWRDSSGAIIMKRSFNVDDYVAERLNLNLLPNNTKPKPLNQ
jgi:hypothetical protein